MANETRSSQGSSATPSPNAAAGGSKVQGEGDYEAARRYREEVKEFLDKSDVEELAREAEPESAQQEHELEQAEEIGKGHSKGDVAADPRHMYPGQDKSGS